VRLLVTRPEPDATRTAAALRARGHAVIVGPLLRIEANPDIDLGAGPYAGVAISSANALRVLASNPRVGELTALPLYAVGRRSAEAARAAGFTTVVSADKDMQALAELIRQRHTGSVLPLLYVAAEDRAGNLGGALARLGIAVCTVALYRAVQATAFDPAVRAALEAGTVDGVLHFSRRTAEAYLGCAQAGGLAHDALAPMQFCISAKAAEPLAAAGAANLKIASHPDEEAMLALIPAADADGT